MNFIKILVIALTYLFITMKILQLNCYSYATSRRLLEDYVDANNTDVILLSETWISDDKTKFKNWPNPQWKPKINTRGGVAILTSPKVKCVRRKDLEVNNECMWCEIQINNQQCLICSVYIPPKHKEDLKKLNTILESIDPKVPLLIGGDFNARNHLWDPQLNPSRDPAWQMGDLLFDIIFEQKLKNS